MNYVRIYDEFIADRLHKQPPDDKYYEVHHIRPRCMGGDDMPSNLIRLTASDHMFAHILLARAYRGTEYAYNLNGAILVLASETLSGARRGVGGKRLGSLALTGMNGKKLRTAVERARAQRAVCNSGVDHPSADRTVYKFVNVDGSTFEGHRVVFQKKYGLSAGTVHRLLADELNTSKCGWRALDPSIDDAERARRGDAQKYTFTNVGSGATKRCTRRVFRAYTNMDWWLVHAIVDARGASPDGWLIA